jgi:hypothetical protein
MQPPHPAFEVGGTSSQNAIILIQSLNSYDPIHLIVIGAALMACTFILLPRTGYFIASAAFHIVAADIINSYCTDISYKPMETQVPYIAVLTFFGLLQVYCALKMFNWL